MGVSPAVAVPTIQQGRFLYLHKKFAKTPSPISMLGLSRLSQDNLYLRLFSGLTSKLVEALGCVLVEVQPFILRTVMSSPKVKRPLRGVSELCHWTQYITSPQVLQPWISLKNNDIVQATVIISCYKNYATEF